MEFPPILSLHVALRRTQSALAPSGRRLLKFDLLYFALQNNEQVSTRLYCNPEDRELRRHECENFKSDIFLLSRIRLAYVKKRSWYGDGLQAGQPEFDSWQR
jgi:hypothetical protein